MAERLVELGSSNRPHGIKGAFCFQLLNPQESILAKGSIITIFPKTSSSSIPPSGQELKIESIHFGNKVICYLEGVQERNRVEQMLPFNIFYPREKFPNLEKGELYLSDLIGMKVVNQQGEALGHVDSFFDNGAQSVLKVKCAHEFFELPFVESFFPTIDLENRVMTMIIPEYD